jgi:hypothetical protein
MGPPADTGPTLVIQSVNRGLQRAPQPLPRDEDAR